MVNRQPSYCYDFWQCGFRPILSAIIMREFQQWFQSKSPLQNNFDNSEITPLGQRTEYSVNLKQM